MLEDNHTQPVPKVNAEKPELSNADCALVSMVMVEEQRIDALLWAINKALPSLAKRESERLP